MEAPAEGRPASHRLTAVAARRTTGVNVTRSGLMAAAVGIQGREVGASFLPRRDPSCASDVARPRNALTNPVFRT